MTFLYYLSSLIVKCRYSMEITVFLAIFSMHVLAGVIQARHKKKEENISSGSRLSECRNSQWSNILRALGKCCPCWLDRPSLRFIQEVTKNLELAIVCLAHCRVRTLIFCPSSAGGPSIVTILIYFWDMIRSVIINSTDRCIFPHSL